MPETSAKMCHFLHIFHLQAYHLHLSCILLSLQKQAAFLRGVVLWMIQLLTLRYGR